MASPFTSALAYGAAITANDPPVLVPVCRSVFTSECGLLDRRGHWAVEPRPGRR